MNPELISAIFKGKMRVLFSCIHIRYIRRRKSVQQIRGSLMHELFCVRASHSCLSTPFVLLKCFYVFNRYGARRLPYKNKKICCLLSERPHSFPGKAFAPCYLADSLCSLYERRIELDEKMRIRFLRIGPALFIPAYCI